MGRHLLPRLAESGWAVRALVHRTPLPEGDWERVRGDMTEPQSAWLDGVDVVLHLAARTRSRDPERCFHENTRATERLTRLVGDRAEPPYFVYMSSIAAGGPWRDTYAEASGPPTAPTTTFGESVLLAEAAVAALPRWLILRAPMVYGGADRSLSRLRTLRSVRVFPTAANRFTGICIDDLAAIVLHVLDEERPNRRLCTLSDGREYTLAKLADHIARGGRLLLKVPLGSPGLLRLIRRLTGNPDAAAYLDADWLQPHSSEISPRPVTDLYALLDRP